MLVIDQEMSDAARLLRASNQARKASLCFAERRQLLRLLVSEKIKAEGLCQLLEYRTPRALPGGVVGRVCGFSQRSASRNNASHRALGSGV